MKLQKVFGIVVGAHLAVLTVLMATPGCRSGAKSKPRPEDTAATVPPDAINTAETDSVSAIPVTPMSYDDLNAGSSYGRAPAAPVSYASGAGSDLGVRFAPTRPGATQGTPTEAAPAPATSSTHTVAKGDSLWAIAKKYGISVGELAAANQLATSATLRLGQQLVVPGRAAADAPAATAEAANTYTVKSGDNLGAIARKHGTTVAELRTANNLSGDNIRVGQKLVIPGNATPLTSAASAGASASPAAAARAGSGTYTVVSGDTLGSIAQRHGVQSGELGVLNNITDPRKLRVGQVLKLPAGAKSSAAAPVAPTPAAPPPARSFTPAPAVVAPPVEPSPVSPVVPIEDATGVTPVSPVVPVEPGEPIEAGATPVFRMD